MTAGSETTFDAVLIAGPTTSGKSAVAIAVARALGGTVVNADSMQVYRDLRVLSARPSPEEEASVPHRLFGHVDGATNFSVGAYVAQVAAEVAALRVSRSLPVLAGGTGLYFKALTEGLSPIPPVSEAVREAVRAHCAGRDTPSLHADLAACDPGLAARLRPSDRLRIMRGLEVHAETGRSLAEFQGLRTPGPLENLRLLKIFLAPDRAVIRARIDARFERMLEMGALDEVAALRRRHLDPMLPVMRAHGVPGLIAHLDGMVSREEAVRRGQADTRAYAKRQMTWFRHQMTDWMAVPVDDVEDVTARILAAARS